VVRAVSAAVLEEDFAVFADAPHEHLAFEGEGGQMLFYNTFIPLPFGLQQIIDRCLAGFYRSAEAIAFDARLIASNAEAFNGAGTDISRHAQRLADGLESVARGHSEEILRPRRRAPRASAR